MTQIYTFMGSKEVGDDGKVVGNSWERDAGSGTTKERRFASAVLGGCGGGIEEVEALTERLEQTPQAWWPQMLAEEWPHALQKLDSPPEKQRQQIQPTPPAGGPSAGAKPPATASGRIREEPPPEPEPEPEPVAARDSVTFGSKNIVPAPPGLNIVPAPPSGASSGSSGRPVAKITKGSTSKIDDVLKRYSPRRVALGDAGSENVVKRGEGRGEGM